MGLFSKLRKSTVAAANAALDKAIDPAKELEMAILELEAARKKALAELISYKATVKQLSEDAANNLARAGEWEARATKAVLAGDDDAARAALKEKKRCEGVAAQLQQERAEADGYAVTLNKSRKAFELKLQMLKLRKGTLATQLAAARGGKDAFDTEQGAWAKFKTAEERIDAEAVESEVDAAMGEDDLGQAFDQRLTAAQGRAPESLGGGADAPGDEDPLVQLKLRAAAEKAARTGLLPERIGARGAAAEIDADGKKSK